MKQKIKNLIKNYKVRIKRLKNSPWRPLYEQGFDHQIFVYDNVVRELEEILGDL